MQDVAAKLTLSMIILDLFSTLPAANSARFYVRSHLSVCLWRSNLT